MIWWRKSIDLLHWTLFSPTSYFFDLTSQESTWFASNLPVSDCDRIPFFLLPSHQERGGRCVPLSCRGSTWLACQENTLLFCSKPSAVNPVHPKYQRRLSLISEDCRYIVCTRFLPNSIYSPRRTRHRRCIWFLSNQSKGPAASVRCFQRLRQLRWQPERWSLDRGTFRTKSKLSKFKYT